MVEVDYTRASRGCADMVAATCRLVVSYAKRSEKSLSVWTADASTPQFPFQTHAIIGKSNTCTKRRRGARHIKHCSRISRGMLPIRLRPKYSDVFDTLSAEKSFFVLLRRRRSSPCGIGTRRQEYVRRQKRRNQRTISAFGGDMCADSGVMVQVSHEASKSAHAKDRTFTRKAEPWRENGRRDWSVWFRVVPSLRFSDSEADGEGEIPS